MSMGLIIFGGMGIFLALWYLADMVFGGEER
jgi:hypothetical protein